MVSGLVSKTLEIVLRELSRAMLGEEAAVHRALLGTPHTHSSQSRVTELLLSRRLPSCSCHTEISYRFLGVT